MACLEALLGTAGTSCVRPCTCWKVKAAGLIGIYYSVPKLLDMGPAGQSSPKTMPLSGHHWKRRP